MEAIRVVVRVRPSAEPEQDASTSPKGAIQPPNRTLVKVVDDQMVSLFPRGERQESYNFCYDQVFDGSATQKRVFEESTGAMVEHLLNGFNATIFAYGATGCGKTHTISGTPQDPGLIFRVNELLFAELAKQKTHKYSLKLSYLEIYNEKICDLLSDASNLAIREDRRGVHVPKLSLHEPRSVQEVEDLVNRGNSRRAQSSTHANAQSSRSHAVLQLRVVRTPLAAGLCGAEETSILSIIDLAGSERASSTKNVGKQFTEGAHINKSLLALGKCINALCTQSAHVPYRDSNLSRLLKFSLSGNCKTVMVACVSPNAKHYDDTLNTLNYANRAKQIKTHSSKNVRTVNLHVTEYKTKIEEQAKVITDLRALIEQRDHSDAKFEELVMSAMDGRRVSLSVAGLTASHKRILQRALDLNDTAFVSPSKRARNILPPQTPQRRPLGEKGYNVPSSVKRTMDDSTDFDSSGFHM